MANTGKVAFPISELSSESCEIDGYWAGDACIDENGKNLEAKKINQIKKIVNGKVYIWWWNCFLKNKKLF